MCRIHAIEPTVNLFRCFYIKSKKNGRFSFSKRSEKTDVCYTKVLDSVKNWNDCFFWVDDFACQYIFPWHTAKNIFKDVVPKEGEFNADDFAFLVNNPIPFWWYPEPFL